jgi:3-phenylpropionate/cinnamic acid dioxygenase small subunit
MKGRSILSQHQQDGLGILNTVYDYAYSLDEKQFDLFADCFADDATIDIVVHGATPPVPHLSGRDSIVEFFRTGRARHTDRRRHVVTNTRVSSTGETASVHSYVVLYSTENGVPSLVCTGQYFDELVLAAGRWRISRKVIELDSMYA